MPLFKLCCQKSRTVLPILAWLTFFEKAVLIFLVKLQNDPTVERCERRAHTLGFGAFLVCNIFAWRDTSPEKMKKASDPIGNHNDKAILNGCVWGDKIICAWGTHGSHLNRGEKVLKIIKTIHI